MFRNVARTLTSLRLEGFGAFVAFSRAMACDDVVLTSLKWLHVGEWLPEDVWKAMRDGKHLVEPINKTLNRLAKLESLSFAAEWTTCDGTNASSFELHKWITDGMRASLTGSAPPSWPTESIVEMAMLRMLGNAVCSECWDPQVSLGIPLEVLHLGNAAHVGEITHAILGAASATQLRRLGLVFHGGDVRQNSVAAIIKLAANLRDNTNAGSRPLSLQMEHVVRPAHTSEAALRLFGEAARETDDLTADFQALDTLLHAHPKLEHFKYSPKGTQANDMLRKSLALLPPTLVALQYEVIMSWPGPWEKLLKARDDVVKWLETKQKTHTSKLEAVRLDFLHDDRFEMPTSGNWLKPLRLQCRRSKLLLWITVNSHTVYAN